MTPADANIDAPCARAYELLDRLNRPGAEADGALVQELADHLEECARCHEDEEGVEGLVSLYKSFSTTYGPAVPSSLEQQILDAMCGQSKEDHKHGRPWSPGPRP